MIKNESNIRIWKANLPLKKLASSTAKTVGIYVDDAFLDTLTNRYPNDYLRMLERLQQALMNQIAYRAVPLNDTYEVSCSVISPNGVLEMFFVSLRIQKGEFYIDSFTVDRYEGSGWVNMKQARRTRKAR